MERSLLVIFTVFVSFASSGCGLLRKKPKAQENELWSEMRAGTRPMGQVSMVSRTGGFILVRTPLLTATQAEQSLIVRDSTGSLTGKAKVTPESKKPFLVADIAEGTPKVGDLVFYTGPHKATQTPLTLTPPAQTSAPAFGSTEDAASSLPPLGLHSGEREELPPLQQPQAE